MKKIYYIDLLGNNSSIAVAVVTNFVVNKTLIKNHFFTTTRWQKGKRYKLSFAVPIKIEKSWVYCGSAKRDPRSRGFVKEIATTPNENWHLFIRGKRWIAANALFVTTEKN